MQTKEVKRVGVIGGGQLAWMMARAAESLGIELAIQTPQPTDPAVAVVSDTVLAAVDDSVATTELASRCDAITFENEFVNLDALLPLEQQGVCFRPSLQVLSPILDKYHQRCYFQSLGLPVPKFIALNDYQNSGSASVSTPSNLGASATKVVPTVALGSEKQHLSPTRLNSHSVASLTDFEFPVVLKARRHGYDGQGTFIIKDNAALEATLQRLQQTPVLLEEFVPFTKELAVIAARSVSGEIVVYPIVETQQEEQVCRRVIAPADVDAAVVAQAEAIAHTFLDSLQAVGVFGIELFLTKEGKVLVNEVAPRTHNSGHFTIDACHTSQFEMHLRAVSGLPLGNPALNCPGAVMINLLGYEKSQSDYKEKRIQIANIPHARVHWYGKTESRPGRKLGHVTVLLETPQLLQAEAIASQVESIWYGS